MWKDGGNSEVLHSSNASLRWVTVFSECSNTAWAYNPIFYISKVCLCTTNWHLYHKDPCPERGLNHSKVVIRKQWKSRNKRSQTADVPPAHDGTDGLPLCGGRPFHRQMWWRCPLYQLPWIIDRCRHTRRRWYVIGLLWNEQGRYFAWNTRSPYLQKY